LGRETPFWHTPFSEDLAIKRQRVFLVLVLFLFAAGAHAAAPKIPDLKVIDQDGRSLHFYSELVHGHTVVINFIFTSCSTICPTMGANFGKLQSLVGKDVRLISLSVDPAADTPARLRAWGERWERGQKWTLVTAAKNDSDALRRAFGVFTPDFINHSAVTWIGNDVTGEWERVDGLAAAAKIASAVTKLDPPAAHYFGGLPLVDQNGSTVDLYRDLMRGRVVVINSFFATCKGSCPVMTATFKRIEDAFRDDGRISLISISVDPANDTPEKLKAYAANVGAKKEWHFLTGTPGQVHAALTKLGLDTETPDGHSNVVLVGNLDTGLWKKVLGLADSGKVIDAVRSVVEDR
jgi:cytochrome oxidase Cu insertion factor (SCO1/SenC/PrrC family)